MEWALFQVASITKTCLLERKYLVFKQNEKLSNFSEEKYYVLSSTDFALKIRKKFMFSTACNILCKLVKESLVSFDL